MNYGVMEFGGMGFRILGSLQGYWKRIMLKASFVTIGVTVRVNVRTLVIRRRFR